MPRNSRRSLGSFTPLHLALSTLLAAGTEGGIRMTCLAQWKGRIQGGQVNDSLWRTVDWLLTVWRKQGQVLLR